jgi:hypothetical protein
VKHSRFLPVLRRTSALPTRSDARKQTGNKVSVDHSVVLHLLLLLDNRTIGWTIFYSKDFEMTSYRQSNVATALRQRCQTSQVLCPSPKMIHIESILLRSLMILVLIQNILVLPVPVAVVGDFVESAEDSKTESGVEPNSSPPRTTQATTKTFVMGLPKSGSISIHDFIQCMNEREEPSATATADGGGNVKPPNMFVSSAHYCCDPNHGWLEGATPAATMVGNADDTDTTAFPCAQHMVTCGSCLLETMQHNSRLKQQSSLLQSPWQNCGTYNVYSSFHVETSKPFSYFLPQHYTLPHLVQLPRSSTHASADDSFVVTWILNTRGTPDIWATNILHWYSITNRFFNSFRIPYYYYDSSSSKDKISTRLLKAVTKEDLEDDLDLAFERMHNRTDHDRRHQDLIQIYQDHAQKIRQFVQNYNMDRIAQPTKYRGNANIIYPDKIQLYEVNIDDADAAVQLATALGYSNDEPTTAITDCWTYDANKLDNDWNDFSLTTSLSV